MRGTFVRTAERLGRGARGAFERVRGWRPRTLRARVLLGVLAVLVLFRLSLPWIVRSYVNDRLAHMDGYVGHVGDVDISLWRGAYQLDHLVIHKIDGDVEVPFLDAPHIDIAVEWRALFDGAVVATLEFERPILNFVGGGADQFGEGNDWRDVVDDLVPITINRLTIRDGAVHYRELSTRPRIDLALTNLDAVASNLSTVRDEDVPLPARLDATGTVQSSGTLEAHVRLDPWAERPTFDLDLGIEELAAAELSPLLEEYAGVDAEAGQFFLYAEIASVDGRFSGYVKPMAEGLSVFRLGEDGDFFDQLGDAIVQLFEDLFENHGTDRFATRVPVSGTFDSIDVSGWDAFIGILSNTFIEAIRHGVEHEVGWRVANADE